MNLVKHRYEDLTNQKFGKLIFLKLDSIRNSKAHWLCKCNCGIEKVICAASIKSGRIISCCCHKKSLCSRRGINNHNWNHSISLEEREIRKENRKNSPNHELWRKKIYVRDNYTCKICNQYGGKLVAHHIYSFHSHIKLRYVISNGITLCNKCHNIFHKKFGRKFNTKKQFNKFIKLNGKF